MNRPNQAISDQELATSAILAERIRELMHAEGTVAAVAYTYGTESETPTVWRLYRTADPAEPWAIGFGFPGLPGALGDVRHNILRCLNTYTCPHRALGQWERKVRAIRDSEACKILATVTLEPEGVEG